MKREATFAPVASQSSESQGLHSPSTTDSSVDDSSSELHWNWCIWQIIIEHLVGATLLCSGNIWWKKSFPFWNPSGTGEDRHWTDNCSNNYSQRVLWGWKNIVVGALMDVIRYPWNELLYDFMANWSLRVTRGLSTWFGEPLFSVMVCKHLSGGTF